MSYGYFIIAIAFISAVVSTTAYILYYRDRDNEQLFQLANRAFYLMTAGVVLSFGLVVFAILTHQFDLNYAYSYSSRILNKYYLLSTLWAGQEGTFLLWLFFTSVFGFILIRQIGRQRPLVLATVLAVQAFLLLILLKKNPFMMLWHVHEEVPIGFMPADGAGLNPLLQNPWMVIHPPTLFLGYSACVVPFAFAVSAFVTRDFTGWLKEIRPWVLFTVMILGTGIMMGGYWAYVTLGWGGYWAWDPVENASIVPWLFSVILLHGILIQAKRKALVRTNLLWGGLVFLSMLWGSYLTRSGVLTDFSVHSFAPSGLSLYMLVFQVAFTGLFLVLYGNFLFHYNRSGENPVEFGKGLFNREVLIFTGMMAVLFIALFVLFGTSAPLITSWTGNPTSLSPDFYNAMGIPVALFMFAALAIAPLAAWKNSGLRDKNTLWISFAVALVATVIASFIGLGPLTSIGGGTALFGPQGEGIANAEGLLGLKFNYFLRFSPYFLFFLSVFVIMVNGKLVTTFIQNNFQKAGGYIAHVGLGFMLIGIITSSVYDQSEKVMLPKGEFAKTDLGYEIRFIDFMEEPDGRDKVKLEVKTANGIYDAYPRFYYSEYNKAYMVNPDVKARFTGDVYISPISFTPGGSRNQKVMQLVKQQTGRIDDDTRVTFNKFDVKMGGGTQEITVRMTATVKGQYGEETHDIAPVLLADNGQMSSKFVDIPGTGYKVKVNKVNASSGSVELGIMLPGGATDKVQDMLAIELSEKPLIS
ncbi:MAG: cytochrome c biogenesis protein CcsA, partial [Calditrichaeota bacterium]|nr:cytochrome c biogenesis protein CcsA [Calditrichota bacterium]